MNTHKKRNAVIAAVAGAALLLGGSTYALWSATADLSGTTIQAGDLALTVDGTTIKVWDVSPDLVSLPDTLTVPYTNAKGDLQDKGRLVLDGATPMVADWTTVPGDQLVAQVPFTVTMVGDNLVARLDVTTLAPDYTDSADQGHTMADYVTITYALFDSAGTLVTEIDPAGAAGNAMTFYYATNPDLTTTADDNSALAIPSGETNFTLAVFVTFDSSSEDQGRDGTQDSITLANSVNLSLTQVRN